MKNIYIYLQYFLHYNKISQFQCHLQTSLEIVLLFLKIMQKLQHTVYVIFNNSYHHNTLFYIHLKLYIPVYPYVIKQKLYRGRRGHDHMEVGFTTTCVISAYHH
jgi:hypothetical protein